MTYVIDRIEGNIAICEICKRETNVDAAEFAEQLSIELTKFPFKTREGMIFNLEYLDEKEVFSVDEATAEAEKEQKKVIRNKLNRLFKRN